ncbi:MAG: isocitrate lyase [Woeseiaceae bacterium]|nr:isocitrate lyase [Woeseiaceae bacterium]
MQRDEQIRELQNEWADNPRWTGTQRDYTAADVVRLRGSVRVEHTLARVGSQKLWRMLHEERPLCALGALTGNQAIQEIQAGLRAIYCSGWQVAGDGNSAGEMYPDQSLYPVDSVPKMVERINNALLRTDEIHSLERNDDIDWLAPIVADAEAGFGGTLNAFELMKAMIRAGASGVHFEDQLSSAKKCGHMGGKVLVPTQEAVSKLTAARLAADVLGVPTVLVARTDADAANLITADADERDHEFITGERTSEGFYRTRAGIDQAIARGLAYAPYSDLLWCETSRPDLEQAARFAEAIHSCYPDQLLAYNCSPSFNWQANLDEQTIAKFQREARSHGLQVPVHHAGRLARAEFDMFRLSRAYHAEGMFAYCATAAARIRRRKARLPRRETPVVRRRRLFRRRAEHDHVRPVLDDRPERLHRGGTVRRLKVVKGAPPLGRRRTTATRWAEFPEPRRLSHPVANHLAGCYGFSSARRHRRGRASRPGGHTTGNAIETCIAGKRRTRRHAGRRQPRPRTGRRGAADCGNIATGPG